MEKQGGGLAALSISCGFLLHTTAEDGDNVDCFVLTGKPLMTGQILECEPVALMEQFEDGEADHNVLAVPVGERFNVSMEVRAILADFVMSVFMRIPGSR